MPEIFNASDQRNSSDSSAPNQTAAQTPTADESQSPESSESQTSDRHFSTTRMRKSGRRMTVAGSDTTVQRPQHRPVEEYSEVMRHEVACTNPMTAFIPKPPTIRFSNQAESETIILLLRKHPITQVGWVLIAIVLALLPILFSSIGFLTFLPPTYKLALAIGWYLLVLGYTFESFLKWFFNIYILTDERVIDIDFLSLIYKNESVAKIDNIEDVSATMSGVFPSLFNYGTVRVQTAGTETEFEFEQVPQPNKVVKLINELILEEEREKLEGRVS